MTGLDFLFQPGMVELAIAWFLTFNLHRRLVQRRFATESV